ncbi:MAG TPA: hypothetical protein DCY89_00125 [Gammaproteobacteria bacterium]|nr:hypothetical protein [Gammaproteobacteria bacterium]
MTHAGGWWRWSLALAGAVLCADAAQSEPTTIEVRVLSEGAKFMGDRTGGARVTLVDVAQGTVLATGVTAGGTGDTERIMQASGRSPQLVTPETAVFRTVLDLTAPRRVRAEVEGPLGLPHVAARVTAERWILPGLGTGPGNGWVLELPGMAVTIIHPAPGTHLPLPAGEGIEVVAEVMMLCGCPLSPGGLWDANQQRVEVSAEAPEGGPALRATLGYAGEPNRFSTRLPLAGAGRWSLTVTAFDMRTGTTGLTRGEVLIGGEAHNSR